MEEKKTPYLCGGTFFTLLTMAKIRWGSNRQIRDRAIREAIEGLIEEGDKNGYTDMLAGLIQMVDPDFIKPTGTRSFSTDTTNFRSCVISYSANIPFDQEYLIDEFDKQIKEHYQDKLEEMHEYVSLRLNRGEDKSDTQRGMMWLMRAVLALLWLDKTIGWEEELYALESGEPVSKKQLLREMDSYCVDSLLLGIWHYIVTKRPLNNEAGKRTFDSWHEETDGETKRSQRIFISPIGKNYPNTIRFYFWGDACEEEGGDSVPKTEEGVVEEMPVKEEIEDGVERADAEPVEGEVVDDIPRGEGKKKKKKKKKKAERIINQMNFFSGDGQQNAHVDKIVINNYNK